MYSRVATEKRPTQDAFWLRMAPRAVAMMAPIMMKNS